MVEEHGPVRGVPRINVIAGIAREAADGRIAVERRLIDIPCGVAAAGERHAAPVRGEAWIDGFTFDRLPEANIAAIKHLRRDADRAVPAAHEDYLRSVGRNRDAVADIVRPRFPLPVDRGSGDAVLVARDLDQLERALFRRGFDRIVDRRRAAENSGECKRNRDHFKGSSFLQVGHDLPLQKS